MSRATIRDVAGKANVGIATVSRVLNNNPSVKETTRQRVLEAIAKLNYSPHPTARRLSLGRTLTVAVILPFLTRPSTVERLRGVNSVLSSSEYDLVLFIIDSPEQRDECFINITGRTRVDGLLAISLPPNDEQARRMVEMGVSTVLVDAHHTDLSRVLVDDFEGGYQATRHLLEFGHRKIAYISDELENSFRFVSMRLRYDGYRRALAEAGVPFQDLYHQQGPHGRVEAAQMAKQLLRQPDPPSAIFAASDTQAFGVLDAAHELGIPVPDQLSIIGYDDIELAEYMNLSTVRQPLFESGVKGAETLLSALEEASNSIVPPRELNLPFELIPRGTTAPMQVF
jgi:DNA-binding LacI/PurR family transcriptional regulator